MKAAWAVAAAMLVGGCGDDGSALGKVEVVSGVKPAAPVAGPTWRAGLWMSIADGQASELLDVMLLNNESLSKAGVDRWFVTERPDGGQVDLFLAGGELGAIREVFKAHDLSAKLSASGRVVADAASVRTVTGDIGFEPTVCAIRRERFAERRVWQDELSRRAALPVDGAAIALAGANDASDTALGDILIVARSEKQLAAILQSTAWRRSTRAAGTLEPATIIDCELAGSMP